MILYILNNETSSALLRLIGAVKVAHWSAVISIAIIALIGCLVLIS